MRGNGEMFHSTRRSHLGYASVLSLETMPGQRYFRARIVEESPRRGIASKFPTRNSTVSLLNPQIAANQGSLLMSQLSKLRPAFSAEPGGLIVSFVFWIPLSMFSPACWTGALGLTPGEGRDRPE